jgi:hypothetical protein
MIMSEALLEECDYDAANVIRTALTKLPAGAAWPAGKIPSPDEIFTPHRQKNVLDITRSLVVGNRGVGKTFWSHALSSPEGRLVPADAYDLPLLKHVDTAFGFKGTITDETVPSPTVIGKALEVTTDSLIVWQAILLRVLGPEANEGLPEDLANLAAWFAKNPEEGELRIRMADEARLKVRRPLVVLFDALDTLATRWDEIRHRTEGLLRLAVLAKGLRATHIKIFMRPDQFADASLFRFPDASKLRAERVELAWEFLDLYALMFFQLWRAPDSRAALASISPYGANLFSEVDGHFRPELVSKEDVQRGLFERVAGRWMGKDKKRGATYSWLVQHLADARGETTPRGFLTALRATAQFERVSLEHAIDYRGIHTGLRRRPRTVWTIFCKITGGSTLLRSL